MDIQTIYDLARQKNINVIQFPLSVNGSISVMDEAGQCFIGIDKEIQDGSVQERTHMIHELGHCVTGSFYNRYASVDSRDRHEKRADKWAVLQLIPAEDLDQAVADGHTEIWDLAEHFGVTEDFVRKAVCYHVHGNLATELYF